MYISIGCGKKCGMRNTFSDMLMSSVWSTSRKPSIMGVQHEVLEFSRKTLTGVDCGIISLKTVAGTKWDWMRWFSGSFVDLLSRSLHISPLNIVYFSQFYLFYALAISPFEINVLSFILFWIIDRHACPL